MWDTHYRDMVRDSTKYTKKAWNPLGGNGFPKEESLPRSCQASDDYELGIARDYNADLDLVRGPSGGSYSEIFGALTVLKKNQSYPLTNITGSFASTGTDIDYHPQSAFDENPNTEWVSRCREPCEPTKGTLGFWLPESQVEPIALHCVGNKMRNDIVFGICIMVELMATKSISP